MNAAVDILPGVHLVVSAMIMNLNLSRSNKKSCGMHNILFNPPPNNNPQSSLIHGYHEHMELHMKQPARRDHDSTCPRVVLVSYPSQQLLISIDPPPPHQCLSPSTSPRNYCGYLLGQQESDAAFMGHLHWIGPQFLIFIGIPEICLSPPTCPRTTDLHQCSQELLVRH